MARTLNTLAEAERYLENYSVALDYSLQGLEIHKQIEDPDGYAKALTGAGVIYRHIGRYEKSLEHIYQAHLYYKKINDINGIANTSNQMGLIYTRLKQFDLAKSFYQLTIDLPEEKITPRTLASATREMAVILLKEGEYEVAKVMIKKAHKIYQDEKNETNQSLTLRILANIYRDQDDKAKAIAYYRESLAIAKQVKSVTYQIKALLPLGAILIDTDIKEAITLLQESLTLSLETNYKSYQLYSYRELRIANKKKGDLLASINFAEKEIAMMKLLQQEREDNKLVLVKATLYSHTKEMELASLKEKAELDKLELSYKNNEIALANQENIIAELELSKNKYANFALVSLLVICLIAVLFIFRGFINSRKHNRELKYLASRDPLTNSLNRRALFDLMDKSFLDLSSLDDYCIIMVDIDYFKAVNDTYGHIIGDKVLCEVAKILQHCVRETDIVARFGGEEFCIVLPKTTKERSMFIAETMRQQIELLSVQDIKVTCSFGVSSIEFKAKDPAKLIEQADLALYQSKETGRNRVTIWAPEFAG
ncbi:diguanylate cyclase [Psychromonas sp. KJ10-10]|uniref:tetratricopeptide repeat-containing diguanylate cyclase n=1 Tax=Psychromonas sp. KJ10-10 TaxID=3391823 RepID=UPI0039B5904B